MRKWWRNRDFILILSLVCGLVAGRAATWTQPLVLPALAVVMTLSTSGVRSDIFQSRRQIWQSALAGLVLNYVILGSVLLGLCYAMIREPALRDGFVVLVAVPPAIAVIPFTDFLRGNTAFSLLATVSCYLLALFLMPLIAVLFLGTRSFEISSLITVILLLILAPLILSRLLLWTSLAERLEPFKGAITNWSFFLVTFTIVGLNRELFLHQPLTLAPIAIIAVLSTFLLGWLIELAGRFLRIDQSTVVSFVLLGTLKNYGIAGGLALQLFSKRTAVPATVSCVFMIVYIIWLNLKTSYPKKSQR
jgi:bile acid:Na+ symporter, BASS family